VGVTGFRRLWALEWAGHIRRFSRFVGVRVGVAYSCNKLALRIKLRNLNLKSQFSIFDSFRDIHSYLRFFEVCGRFMGVRVGVANFFLDQSIGIDENTTFQLKFLF